MNRSIPEENEADCALADTLKDGTVGVAVHLVSQVKCSRALNFVAIWVQRGQKKINIPELVTDNVEETLGEALTGTTFTLSGVCTALELELL